MQHIILRSITVLTRLGILIAVLESHRNKTVPPVTICSKKIRTRLSHNGLWFNSWRRLLGQFRFVKRKQKRMFITVIHHFVNVCISVFNLRFLFNSNHCFERLIWWELSFVNSGLQSWWRASFVHKDHIQSSDTSPMQRASYSRTVLSLPFKFLYVCIS